MVVGKPWWYWTVLGVAGAGTFVFYCSHRWVYHFLHLPLLAAKSAVEPGPVASPVHGVPGD